MQRTASLGPAAVQKNKSLRITLGFGLAVLGLLGGCAPELNIGEKAQKLVSEGALVLDVRTAKEFATGHIPEALNIHVSEVAGRLSEIPRDRAIVIHCGAGVRSAIAAKILSAEGYDVFDLGRLDRWLGKLEK